MNYFTLIFVLLLRIWSLLGLRKHSNHINSLKSINSKKENDDVTYNNLLLQGLSTFLPKANSDAPSNLKVDAKRLEINDIGVNSKSRNLKLGEIDFRVAKRRKTSIDKLARDLYQALNEREWFVTGLVDPTFFSDDFRFTDPDVKLTGIRQYAEGVNRLFDQRTSRAEVITVQKSDIPNSKVDSLSTETLQVVWRLSGKVNIGPGLTIKPFLVYTDLAVDKTSGLIIFQEDKFSKPRYDILISAILPFVGNLISPPAEPASILRQKLSKK